MNHVMVRYKVKADRVAENEVLIAKVFEQLRQGNPKGLRYASFKLDDGLSFVHLVARDGSSEDNPLHGFSAFREFTAGVNDRCDEAPEVTHMNALGAFEYSESAQE